MPDFDAIVVGSGITGGWAAKELTERGLKTLMIERGYEVEHRKGYTTEFKPPWEMPYRGYGDPEMWRSSKRRQSPGISDEWVAHFFVDDDVDVYETPAESDFKWIRGYHTGGRSVMWGRQSYRMSEVNFASNARDGHGIDWPVRYSDLAPWYDHVEEFIGVNGTIENLPAIPDGKFQPSMGLNPLELYIQKLFNSKYTDRRLIPSRQANLTQAIGDRMPCQLRSQCGRGCSFGAYFSTQSSTLPAAKATGRLTLVHNSIVDSVEYDPKTKRATGVRIINTETGERTTRTARVIFLCASAYNSVSILMRSKSKASPNGLGNSGGALGLYAMDHGWGVGAVSTVPVLQDAMYLGRKPGSVFVPRFVNMDKQETDFFRGYSIGFGARRQGWDRGGQLAGIGVPLKNALRQPGPWRLSAQLNIEMLPRPTNKISLNVDKLDKYGLPLTKIDVRLSDNEEKAAAHGLNEALSMLALVGGEIISKNPILAPPGTSIHEMGGACMGNDPRKSVTNKFNQVHDAANVFVTDGSAMCSTGDRNPSLTYMALTARAAAHAADLLKQNAI